MKIVVSKYNISTKPTKGDELLQSKQKALNLADDQNKTVYVCVLGVTSFFLEM